MHQDVADLLKKMAESKEFLQATGKKINPDRMQDRDFINRFLAFYLFDYETEYTKEDDLDNFMNKALVKLAKLNETEKNEIFEKFKQSMLLSFQLFGKSAFSKQEKPNRINKALFEVISVAFAKLDDLRMRSLINQKELFKSELYKTIEEKFRDSLSSGTGGQSNVHLRHREFNNLINSFLK